MNKNKKKLLKSSLEYSTAAALVLFVMLVVMRVHEVEMSVPFVYQGDAIEWIGKVKRYINNEHGSLLYAPYSTEHGNRLIDSLGLFFSSGWILIVRVISLFTDDSVMQINLYYLLTFFLCAFTSIYAMRQLNIPCYITIPLSTLFTFLPGHFMRSISHLMSSSYYLVPLMCLVLVWIWSAKPVFFIRKDNKWKIDILNRKSITAIIVLLILGPVNHYYSLFFSFLALAAGACAAIGRKSFIHLVTAFILIGLAALSIAKEHVPEKLYCLTEKTVATQIQRSKVGQPISSYGDTEHFGLKIVQMVLPMKYHRNESLRKITRGYNKAHVITENSASTIGIVASVGFFVLIFNLLFVHGVRPVLHKLAILNIFAVLLATIGGFGSLVQTFAVNFLPSTSKLAQVRSYNRISVFIAFFSLLAIAWLFKTYSLKISGKFGSRRLGSAIACFIGIAVICVGLYDQTSPAYKLTRGYAQRENAYESDREFFTRVDHIAPKNGMIFQLPFLVHHGPAPHRMRHYIDNARGHLFSDHLKWTYGGDRGSDQIAVYEFLASLSPLEMIPFLNHLGFDGVYIDARGYEKRGKSIIGKFKKILGEPSVHRRNRELFYFDLTTAFEEKMFPDVTREEAEEILQKELNFNPRTIGVHSGTRHGIGKLIQKKGQFILTSVPGKAGYLSYGPYIKLPPGKYRVEFVLKAIGKEKEKGGIVDVAYVGSKTKKKTIKLSQKDRWVTLPIVFKVSSDKTEFEFRVASNGKGRIHLKKIFLWKL